MDKVEEIDLALIAKEARERFIVDRRDYIIRHTKGLYQRAYFITKEIEKAEQAVIKAKNRKKEVEAQIQKIIDGEWNVIPNEPIEKEPAGE